MALAILTVTYDLKTGQKIGEKIEPCNENVPEPNYESTLEVFSKYFNEYWEQKKKIKSD